MPQHNNARARPLQHTRVATHISWSYGDDSNGGSLAFRLHSYDGEDIKWAASRELQMVMYGSGGGLLLVGVRPAIAHNSRPILVSVRMIAFKCVI